MKRFIKTVVLLLALLVIAGVIFACTSVEKEQPDTPEEETDIVYTVVMAKYDSQRFKSHL